jgi:hypothetical protein
VTAPDTEETRTELLDSSRRLRDELLAAVGKLDSYIEQLRATADVEDEP